MIRIKIEYLIDAGLIIILAAVVAWQKELFSADSLSVCMGILSDCFIVPGFVFAGIGAISWASTKGVYDMLSFGGGRAVRWFVPGMDKERYENFYKYKQYKEEKGRKWHPHLLICGMAAIVIAVITYLIYCFC